MNFFGDVSAFGQALLGYPLFVIAGWIIGEKTRSAAHHFAQAGLVRADQVEDLDITKGARS